MSDSKIIKLRCGGVPEHFNLPWRLAQENQVINDIELSWKDFGGGTGQMCEALRNDEIDLAILLTEGALKDISNGNPSKIVSHYVTSPLKWGVHTGSSSPINVGDEILNPVFAISRYTSGSHLMAYLYAQKLGVELTAESFSVIQNLQGAAVSLTANPDQLFLWEKFTTQPMVDSGVFKRLDIYPTPWPPFVVVVSNSWLRKHGDLIQKVISEVLGIANEFINQRNKAAIISERYNLELSESQEWLSEVEWARTTHLDYSVFKKVKNALLEMGEMDADYRVTEALFNSYFEKA